MSPARQIRVVLTSNALEYLAFRFTQIALPLVVLRELDSAAAAGLVGGMSGLPVVTSPWWARRLRQRLADGRGLALVSLWQAGTVLLVPIALLLGLFHPVLLGVVGLAVGVSDSLGSPGRTALLGDLGDELGEGAATKVVTWDDACRRMAMVVGPALAGLGVHLGWVDALLWIEGFGLVVSALLVRRVVTPAGRAARALEQGADEPAPGILESVRGRPEILRGWVMRGTSCLFWFAFALGLAVLGQETGQPGTLYGTAIAAYGIGAFGMTLVMSQWTLARRPLRIATTTWVAQGLAFAAMSAWTTPVPIGVCAVVTGAVTVVGIRAMTQLLLTETTGASRRAAIAGQSILVDVTVSVGMLGGGLLLDHVGPQPVLLVTGLITSAVALAAGLVPVRTAALARSASTTHPTRDALAA